MEIDTWILMCTFPIVCLFVVSILINRKIEQEEKVLDSLENLDIVDIVETEEISIPTLTKKEYKTKEHEDIWEKFELIQYENGN